MVLAGSDDHQRRYVSPNIVGSIARQSADEPAADNPTGEPAHGPGGGEAVGGGGEKTARGGEGAGSGGDGGGDGRRGSGKGTGGEGKGTGGEEGGQGKGWRRRH